MQTHSKLDVETSRFLFYFEAASRRPPILCRPVWRARRFLKKPKSRLSASSHGRHLNSVGAKLLIASTALRAYRNRHLGTPMRCCEAWKSIENCCEPISFECVDFQRLSRFIVNLTRENLAEREAEITNLPWTLTEKDNAQARCRIGQRAWRTKKTCFVSALSLMKRTTPWKTKMSREEGFVRIEVPFSKHVSKARDITSRRISYDMLRRLLKTSVGSLIGPRLMSSLS